MLSLIADIAGIAAAVFSLFAWIKARQIQKELEMERTRLKQKVQIVLRHGGQSIPLSNILLTRAELTRSEIMGYLGMLPTKEGRRFNLSHTSTREFLEQIEGIKEGTKEGTLVIPCTQAELKQFDFASVGNI